MEINLWVLVEMLPSQLHKAQGKVHFIIPQTVAVVVCYCHYPSAFKPLCAFYCQMKVLKKRVVCFQKNCPSKLHMLVCVC